MKAPDGTQDKSEEQSELIPRKSLSALYREKKEREQLPTDSSPSDTVSEHTIRTAVDTVLGDILGRDHRFGRVSSPNGESNTSVRRVYISRAADTPEITAEQSHAALFDELRSSVPRTPAAAGEESPLSSPRSPSLSSSVYYTPDRTPKAMDRESMLSSREKILEQVRRSRKDEHQTTPKDSDVEELKRPPPPRSILKHRPEQKATCEPMAEGGEKRLPETGTILDGGSEPIAKEVTVVTQQVETLQYTSSPSPLSSLTSPSSVSSAKINLRSPSPPSEDRSEESKHFSIRDITPGNTSPLPYKSPFRNFGSPPEPPSPVKLFSAQYAKPDVTRVAEPEVDTPDLPKTHPPGIPPDVVEDTTRNETHEDTIPVPHVKEPEIRTQLRPSWALPMENGHFHSAPARPRIVEEEDADHVQAIPHSLNRSRVHVFDDGEEKLVIEENTVCREWDPTLLLEEMYKVRSQTTA